jgi:hypothetical protein
VLPLHLENGRPKHRLRATRRGHGRRVRPGRDCLSRCEFPSSSRLTSAHMCAAFAAPVAMKCEIDARRGYRLRHRSRYIGHIQSLCDSRGLACGPMRFTANTRPDMRPGTVGRNDISAVLLSPGTAPIDSLTRRQIHGALHDKPPTVIGHCGCYSGKWSPLVKSTIPVAFPVYAWSRSWGGRASVYRWRPARIVRPHLECAYVRVRSQLLVGDCKRRPDSQSGLSRTRRK